ncbi:MAG: hypothetical protein ACRCX7_08920 [Cetobacterium sp.]|uniref:hypothetical protein n=1 Tax=Cetobacterium sp. TaxID=2071632 RepID=UPI003EE584F4
MKRINNFTPYLSLFKYMVILRSKKEGILEFKKIKSLKEKESYIQELKNKKDQVSYIIVKELKNNKYVKVDVIF